MPSGTVLMEHVKPSHIMHYLLNVTGSSMTAFWTYTLCGDGHNAGVEAVPSTDYQALARL